MLHDHMPERRCRPAPIQQSYTATDRAGMHQSSSPAPIFSGVAAAGCSRLAFITLQACAPLCRCERSRGPARRLAGWPKRRRACIQGVRGRCSTLQRAAERRSRRGSGGAGEPLLQWPRSLRARVRAKADCVAEGSGVNCSVRWCIAHAAQMVAVRESRLDCSHVWPWARETSGCVAWPC